RDLHVRLVLAEETRVEAPRAVELALRERAVGDGLERLGRLGRERIAIQGADRLADGVVALEGRLEGRVGAAVELLAEGLARLLRKRAEDRVRLLGDSHELAEVGLVARRRRCLA